MTAITLIKETEDAAPQAASFISEPATEHLHWQYIMLPRWSAQRREYETLTPKHWKHQLLPGWIAELEARLAGIVAEGQAAATQIEKAKKDLTKAQKIMGLQRRESIKLAEGAIAHWQAVRSGLEREYRALQALIEAHRLRHQQGVAMFGFEDLLGGQDVESLQ